MENREIKFRSFNTKKNIMASVSHFNWTGKVHVSYKQGPEKEGYFFGGNSVGDDWEKEDHILMQYTGLKDKNGKEIYEGDIWEKTTYPRHTIVVEFEKGKYNVSDYLQSSGRIIGNIYENPEKLPEKSHKKSHKINP